MTTYNQRGEITNNDLDPAMQRLLSIPTSDAKSTIADKIHQAVSGLLDTEVRLNADLLEARNVARGLKGELEAMTDEKLHIEQQLRVEKEARQALEVILRKVAELVK